MKLRKALKLIIWILAMQFLLINISAAFHAYRFTHFRDLPARPQSKNVLAKTWRLFAGPVIYKEPSGAAWQNFTEYSIPLSSGIKMNTWYRKNAEDKGCVIFFHGVTSGKRVFANEARKFLEWGFDVLLVDFRGHGNSSGKETSFGMTETEEVEAAYKWVRGRGTEKIILYGSSMGAAVVIKAVSDKGLQPAAIIADMPFASMHDHFKSRVKTLGFPGEPFAAMVTFWVGIENGYNGFGHDVKKYSEELKCPVAIQWGDKDHLVNRKEVESVYEAIPAEKKFFFLYPGADHHSYLYSHPLQWAKNIKGFVDSI